MTAGYNPDGTLRSIPVVKYSLSSAYESVAGKVKYVFGVKPALGASFKESDCSGFVRWILHKATSGVVKIPQGSWYQNGWCEDLGFKHNVYREGARLRDNRLRIAFIRPQRDKPGHVWLILNGQTMECCSGRGVCRRPWNNGSLLSGVTSCYVLTDVLG